MKNKNVFLIVMSKYYNIKIKTLIKKTKKMYILYKK